MNVNSSIDDILSIPDNKKRKKKKPPHVDKPNNEIYFFDVNSSIPGTLLEWLWLPDIERVPLAGDKFQLDPSHDASHSQLHSSHW